MRFFEAYVKVAAWTRMVICVFGLVGFGSGLCAEEWSGYRGPTGDGISHEKIAGAWPASGLKKLWTAPTENGFGSFVVGGGKAYTLVSRTLQGAPLVLCLALDAATGKEVWAAPTGVAKFQGGGDSGAPGNKGGDGPRSTPAVHGDKVFVYSAAMVLLCLDANTGKQLWKHDVANELAGKNIGWSSAMSPVLEKDLVLIGGGGPGSALMAFKQNNGEIAWKSGDETMTHATPVVASIGGVRQAVYLMESGLVAVQVSDGKELWKFPFPYRTATACSPVVSDNTVFCTAGYGVGAAACQVKKTGNTFETSELWRGRGEPVASLWSTPVCKDGYLYGMISFKKFAEGPLKCVDLKTGDIKWEKEGFGAGNVVLAGDKLVALTDAGEVVLAAANPESYKELGRFKAISGKCWSTPAISNGKLFVRSTTEGACLALP